MATYFERLKKYFEENPIEILEKEWEDIRKQVNQIPDVNECMYKLKKMPDIFKDSHFGKVYKTISNRRAVYVGSDDYGHLLVIEGMDSISHYDGCGRLTYPYDREYDIVSERTKEVDENELDRLAKEYADRAIVEAFNTGILS